MGSKENMAREPIKTKATQRFKPGRIFSELGFSASLVTPELAAEIKRVCNEELQREAEGKARHFFLNHKYTFSRN